MSAPIHWRSRWMQQQLQKYQFRATVDPDLFRFSDWHGIMERDNQQADEAEGVQICHPPSDCKPAGKIH